VRAWPIRGPHGSLRCMAPRSTLLAFALLAETCVADISLNCKIFDETMVCDNERSRLHRAEVRTCSG